MQYIAHFSCEQQVSEEDDNDLGDTSLIVRVSVSISNVRQITQSKEYLFICPMLQMETEGALLMESLGVKSLLFSVIESNGMLVSRK